jgi:glucose/arabinose dehydrogenase
MVGKGHKNELMVVLIIMLLGSGTIWASSYDVALTFGNVGFLAYRLDSFKPADADLNASIGEQNPTLTLQLGKRYQVTITDYLNHPFEIISKAPSAGADKVLLSMGTPAGVFESDPDVAWDDDKLGTVTFTMTFSLYTAMTAQGKTPGYRCRIHTTTMRGDFVVEGLPITEQITKGVVSIYLETVAAGLAAPLDLKTSPDGTGRLFVVDQAGKVYLIANNVLQSALFLDLTNRLVTPLGIIGSHDANDYDERGFLGLAFHPDFANPQSAGYQKIYTYTSEPVTGTADFTTEPAPDTINHQSVVAEWMVSAGDANQVDPNSRREIIRIDEPQFNHNAGMLAFGPDGYLYISLGDGGAANDVGDGHGLTGNGQNINTLHGSIVRIDPLDPLTTSDSNDAVSANGKYRVPADNPFVGVDGADEIFAYGFRNPFRFSFDSMTGNLIVADVGQNNVEEIDIIKQGGNYGWNFKEGSFRFNPATGMVSGDLIGLPQGLIDPIAEYDHDDGIAVVGGYVYYGMAIPALAGKYVFGDFSRSFAAPAGRLFYADLGTGLIQELIIGADNRELGLYVKGFGVDADGEIYVLASSKLGPYGTGGVVLKIVGL